MSRYVPLNKSFSKLKRFPWAYHSVKKIYSFDKQKWRYIKNRLKRAIKKRFWSKRKFVKFFNRKKRNFRRRRPKYKCSAFVVNGVNTRKFDPYLRVRVIKPKYKTLLQNRQSFRYLYGHNRFKFYKMKKLSRFIVKKSSNERTSISYNFTKHLEMNPVIVLLREGLLKKFTDAKFLVRRKKVKIENKTKNLLPSSSFMSIDPLMLFFFYPYFFKFRLSHRLKQKRIIRTFIKRFLVVRCNLLSRLKLSNYNYLGKTKFLEFKKTPSLFLSYFSQENQNCFSYYLTLNNLALIKANKLFYNGLKKSSLSIKGKSLLRVKNSVEKKDLLSLNNTVNFKSVYYSSNLLKSSLTNKKQYKVLGICLEDYFDSKLKKNNFKKEISKNYVEVLEKDLKKIKSECYLSVFKVKRFNSLKPLRVKKIYKKLFNKKKVRLKLKKHHKSNVMVPFDSHYEVNSKLLMFCNLDDYSLISYKKKEAFFTNLGVIATNLSY